nr:hypothetical protein [Ardenticatenales bacterium]
MRYKLSLLALLLLVSSLIVLAPVRAEGPDAQTRPSIDGTTKELRPAGRVVGIYGELPTSGTVKVIVQLKGAPLASYQGGVVGLSATSPRATGGTKLDVASPRSLAYVDYLKNEQQHFMSVVKAVSPKVISLANYQAAFNGMALELPVADVYKLLTIPGVLRVEVNKIERVATDSSGEFIGAPVLWEELGAANGSTAGEGVIVGIIDTGIYNPASTVNSDGLHPSLVDPSPVGGDYSAMTKRGVCAGAQQQDGTFGPCNDKLIGAWWYNNTGIANAGEAHSPLDQD